MSVRDEPLVSVLMTAYNREKYIADAIESVLASTYINFELIVVDDCSVDNTVAIAKGYEANDSRIRVYLNETNLKDYPNRNKAASYARGKYIKYLDSDDTIYPWGLQAMVYCMEKYPEAGYGLMSYDLTTEEKLPLLFSPINAYNGFYFRRFLIIAGPSGSIIRRDVFEHEGGFNGKSYTGDTGFWLHLSKKYPVVAMPLDLIWWRQHDSQQIKDEYKNREVEAKRFFLFLNALEDKDCPLPDPDKTMAIQNLKNRYARNMAKYAATGQLKRSLSLYKAVNFRLVDLFKSLFANKYPPAI